VALSTKQWIWQGKSGYYQHVQFHEKLRMVVTENSVNKSKASRDAGLPESTISSYLAKPDSLPRIDIALKLSKVLDVPFEWLADDSQDWPPPSGDNRNLNAIPDHELMAEACRRLANQAAKVTSIVQQIQGLPWSELADELVVIPLDAPLPEKFTPIMRWLYLVDSLYTMLGEFDASEKLDFYVSKPPSVRDLRDRVKELKSPDTDLSDAKKYRELRELSEAHRRNGIDPSAFDLEGFRRRLAEKRNLITAPKKLPKVRKT
jgi:hypothetical protein